MMVDSCNNSHNIASNSVGLRPAARCCYLRCMQRKLARELSGIARSPQISVQSSEAKPYDQTVSPALMEIRLNETFAGGIDGESTVRALQVRGDDRSASMVSMQRFCGKLGGRQGTFVLQGAEIVENGKIKAHAPGASCLRIFRSVAFSRSRDR